MLATALPTSAPFARPSLDGAASFDTNDFARRLIAGEVRTYDANSHLYYEGDAASHVYRIASGNVSVYRMMPDGRRQIVDLAYPGDVIGLGAPRAHASNAQAISRTRVSCVPVAVMHDMVRRDPTLGLALCAALSRDLQAAQERLLAVGRCTASERLAGFLLGLSRRNARNGDDSRVIVLPITRSDIADCLGLTTETVSRTFTAFRADGLIALEQGVLVTILDMKALTDLAQGERKAVN